MTWEMALKEEGEEKWQEGAQQTKLETARRMLEASIGTLEQIADITALPIEQVEQLRRELSAVNA